MSKVTKRMAAASSLIEIKDTINELLSTKGDYTHTQFVEAYQNNKLFSDIYLAISMKIFDLERAAKGD